MTGKGKDGCFVLLHFEKNCGLEKQDLSIYLRCQVFPFSVLLCPPAPISFANISYLSCSQSSLSPPQDNAFVVLLHIPPSICVALSVTSLPCQALREGGGRHKSGHCPRLNLQNINSVVVEQQHRALASNLSDLMMSGPPFLGPLYNLRSLARTLFLLSKHSTSVCELCNSSGHFISSLSPRLSPHRLLQNCLLT